MFGKKILLVIIGTLLTTLAYSSAGKEIIGYYAVWKYYERGNLMKPSNLKYDRVTMLNYAFFAPDKNGNLSGTDAWADSILLRGEHDWDKGGYVPNTSLIDLAHQNDVKVLVSIGGWTLSKNFPGIAADPARREKFAEECVRVIREYGFDGIDVDWEYPGYSAHNGTSADKRNFTLLMAEVRQKLDSLTQVTGQYYPLTAAVSAAPQHAANLELDKLVGIMDMFNIMTYDFSGTWDAFTGHNSPLYQGKMPNSSFNFDAAFRLYHEKYNVPAEQINLGIAFYGRSFKGCNGPGEPHAGADLTNFPKDDGAPMYHEIMEKIDLYERHWDEESRVPYLSGKDIQSYVTYDDEESICQKAEYVKNKGAAGVLIWEISGDYLDKNTTPLQDKLYEVLQEGKTCKPDAAKISAFTATVEGTDVVLAWSTESEINSDVFVVEYLKDSSENQIETIGTVKAAGNSVSALSYTLTDMYPPAGVRHYRLRTVDKDGESYFSETISATLSSVLGQEPLSSESLRIYPNPAYGSDLFLEIPEAFGVSALYIYNMAGGKIAEVTDVSPGVVNVMARSGPLQKGIYILEIRNASSSLRKKVVIN